MDFLTVQDGLYLLARVRGVPFSRIDSIVQTISSLFLLDPFLHNYIHQLSGGTKRRLHAALALIGKYLIRFYHSSCRLFRPTISCNS
jgi:ABC-type multidrug transport system ATPase subunit